MAITLSSLNESFGNQISNVLSKIPGAGSLLKSKSAEVNKFEFLPVPEDEYPHKMVFWINALDIGKYKPSAKDINNTDSPVISTGETSSSFSKYQKVSSALIPHLEGITKSIDKFTNMFSSGDEKSKSNTVTNFMKDVLGSVPKLNRTNTCIVLPIPQQLSADLNIDWQNTEGGLIGNAVSLADQAMSGDMNFGPALTDFIGKEGVRLVAKMASGFGATGPEAAIDQITKKVSNPRPEVLFKGVGFRQFSWSWTMYASNKKQAKTIWNICQAFKFASLPELDMTVAGAYMIYPYTVDVEIHSNGKPNDWLFKTSTCAINNVSINYSENGRVAFFDMLNYDDMQGAAPVGVTLSISLTEMEIMTKNRLLTSATNKSPDSIDFMDMKRFGQSTGRGCF